MKLPRQIVRKNPVSAQQPGFIVAQKSPPMRISAAGETSFFSYRCMIFRSFHLIFFRGSFIDDTGFRHGGVIDRERGVSRVFRADETEFQHSLILRRQAGYGGCPDLFPCGVVECQDGVHAVSVVTVSAECQQIGSGVFQRKAVGYGIEPGEQLCFPGFIGEQAPALSLNAEIPE